MTKQDFIEKWIGWVSYTDRENLKNEMETDLEAVSQALRIHDVVGRSEQLCGFFDPDNRTSSATKCKCGREKWQHPKAT